VDLQFFSKPYERIISQNVKAECSSHTSNKCVQHIFFLLTNFVYVCQSSSHLRTISLFTRSILGKHRKRTRK